MLGKSFHRMLSATLVLLVFGALLGAAWAQKGTVLYSFCAQTSCADGANPMAGLVFDQKGNLYGTTSAGGSGIHGQWGAVFKLAPEGKYTVLYSFCEQNGCSDGALPNAGLIFDRKGDVYGTTLEGGARGSGVVFKLTPEGDYSVLYNFCVLNGCTDGGYPAAGLVFDQKGNLYGTTVSGGANGQGVVFKLTPKGKETVLYSFCALKSSQNDCADGALPYAGLVLDEKGNLYGTTFSGPTTPTLATVISSTDVALCSSLRQMARRQSSTASVRSTPPAPMGRVPSQGWSSTRKETCMGRPGWAGITTPATRAAKVAASYSSLLQKARRQSCTGFARKTTASTGPFPMQGWSSARKGICMGRPSWAGPPEAASYSSSLQKGRKQSSTASVGRTTAQTGNSPMQA
jgi:uncharacterized repeat protein (TIGR03803 family)